jgi:uncharacterized membrane protein
LLVKRDSRFVSFHALQVLLFHLLYLFFSMPVMGGVFAAVAGFALHPPATQHASPPAFIFFFVPVWLGMMGWWVLMLMAAIVYGIKAGRGEWTNIRYSVDWPAKFWRSDRVVRRCFDRLIDSTVFRLPPSALH